MKSFYPCFYACARFPQPLLKDIFNLWSDSIDWHLEWNRFSISIKFSCPQYKYRLTDHRMYVYSSPPSGTSMSTRFENGRKVTTKRTFNNGVETVKVRSRMSENILLHRGPIPYRQSSIMTNLCDDMIPFFWSIKPPSHRLWSMKDLKDNDHQAQRDIMTRNDNW